MEVITKRAITDATMVITGGNGDFVVVGVGFGIVVVATGGLVVTGAGVVFSTTTVVNDTGGALPRCEVDPVLKTVSEPNWFETVNRTSYAPSNGYVWDGFCSEEPVPSPNSQLHEVGFPADKSRNCTTNGALPWRLSTVNSAIGVWVTVI